MRSPVAVRASSSTLALVARARLRAVVMCPYFSSALFALTVLECAGLGTVVIDVRHRLYVDPEAVSRWSVDEFAGVLIHEVNHVVRGHDERCPPSANGDSWNVCGDLEINDDLDEAGIPLPDGGLRPRVFNLPVGKSAEWYYERVAKSGSPLGTRVVSGGECGSGADGVRRDYELPADDAMAPGLGGVQLGALRTLVANEVLRHPGRAPAGLTRWAVAQSTPQVSWQNLLRSHVRRGINTRHGQSDFTYSRPSRRRVAGVVLPAMRRPEVSMAIVIDTSGSMGGQEVSEAYTEARAAARQAVGGRVTLISCDADARVITVGRLPDSIPLVGGGGTDMGEGLTTAAGLDPVPDVVVVITDGGTPWPDEKPTRLSRSEVVVVLVGNAHRTTGPEWCTTVTTSPT